MEKTIDKTELLDPNALENRSDAEKEIVIDAEKVGNSPKAVNRDRDAGGIIQQNVNPEAIRAGASETGGDSDISGGIANLSETTDAPVEQDKYNE